MYMDKFEKGKVSICIPTYNGAAFILDTIQSVLKQDYKNMEIIVNDDCSQDHTLDLVKSIHDPRIKIFVNEKNLGLVENWNKTVSRATGEYTKLMCQDDLLCKNAIRRQVRILDKNPGAALTIGNTYVINSAGKMVMKRERFKQNILMDGKKYAMKSLKGRNIYSEPPNILYRTKYFYDVGYYDTSLIYTPDWDFGLKLSYLGCVACSKNYIMKFRISDSSETYRLYTQMLRASMKDSDRLIEKHRQIGKLNISGVEIIWFKVVIRIGAVLRFVFIKCGQKFVRWRGNS